MMRRRQCILSLSVEYDSEHALACNANTQCVRIHVRTRERLQDDGDVRRMMAVDTGDICVVK